MSQNNYLITFRQENIEIQAKVVDLKINKKKKVLLDIIVTPKDYKIIDSNNLFGLFPEKWGPILGDKFDEKENYYISLRLNSKNDQELIFSNHSTKAILKSIINNSDSQLSINFKSTNSWLALNVTQAMDIPSHLKKSGSLYFGFQTTWD